MSAALDAGRCDRCGHRMDPVLTAEGLRRCPSCEPEFVAAVAPERKAVMSGAPPPAVKDGVTPLRTIRLADVQHTQARRVTSVKALPLWHAHLAALVGEGESCKTLTACHAVLDVAEGGSDVLVIDGEMSAPDWRKRLLDLGASDPALSRVHYAEMGDDSASADEVRATVRHLAAVLVVWDSALSMISRTVSSENDNAAVSRVYDRLREVVRDGPAGLIVDHTAKGSVTRTSRGATAKFNALDISYGMQLTEGSVPGPESPEWHATITVDKDRHGLLGDRRDMDALFHPLGGGALRVEITTSGKATHRLTQTSLSIAVAKITALDPPPTSANDAAKRIGGTRMVALDAYKTWKYMNSEPGTRTPVQGRRWYGRY